MIDHIRKQLAPHGALRVGVNLSNFLLVTGQSANGAPEGVSPDMGKAIADKLDMPVEYVTFATPGEVADAARDDAWDIANIGAEPERAKTITFTPAYCEIEATYLVPPGSTMQSIDEVDIKGNRIAVYARSAYGLWLVDHIQNAELIKSSNMDESFDIFVEQKLEALAGIRPRLVKDLERLPGARILDGQFSAVQQAIGCQPDRLHAAAFLKEFVRDSIASGFVAGLIEKHGVRGLLSVAKTTD
ncbi:MAG: transporter substrate-binding domain-containing protein [Gammaproteobacteria bacterium]|nr:transporter substrate-binding domain-containing protein [Gammaproteobacteria bacterium]